MRKKNKIRFQAEFRAEKAYQTAVSIFFYLCSLVAFLSFTFSTQYLDVEVNGPSMKPTINEQWNDFEQDKRDVVYINFKSSYSRGDIIVVERTSFIIKRLIAISGDRLRIEKNALDEVEIYVNDALLIENYIVNKSGLETTFSNFENLKDLKPELFENEQMIIPENYVFYLGDNRARSQDCSIYGPVSKEKVIGKVDIIIPYSKTFVGEMFKTILNWFI